MGRPCTDLQKYIAQSQIKIATWKQDINTAVDEPDRIKIKNKIAALRTRMKSKRE